MEKYTQQETIIQKLQTYNSELMRQLESMEFNVQEVDGSDSDQTEMMHGEIDGASNFSKS